MLKAIADALSAASDYTKKLGEEITQLQEELINGNMVDYAKELGSVDNKIEQAAIIIFYINNADTENEWKDANDTTKEHYRTIVRRASTKK